jgi:signal transduction histidine kinase
LYETGGAGPGGSTAAGIRSEADASAFEGLLPAKRLEVGLIGLRWLAVAFGVLQSLAAVRAHGGSTPDYTVPLGFALVAVLAVANVAISILTERAPTPAAVRRIGAVAFAIDIAVITGLVWVYTTPTNSLWVIAYVLPLEGALRFGLAGALVAVAVAIVSEPAREYAVTARLGLTPQPWAIVFRVGVDIVVALVAGLMARSLRREAERARDRAWLAEEAATRLQELDQMKSDFVAITSHELRTPLAAIRGFVNTLLRRIDRLSQEEVREFLTIVDRQTDRLTHLVEDLLVVSKIEAGKLGFDPKPVEAASFADSVVRGLGDGADRVRIDLPGPIPTFVADPNRLGQVLTNLLQNALKFSAPERPVRLVATAEGEADEVLRFDVVDEGVGIAPEEFEAIFERFHQTEAASTREAEGTGLGLYITKKLVEAMDGSIELTSRLGSGSTFTVRLPLRRSPAPARPSEAARVG